MRSRPTPHAQARLLTIPATIVGFAIAVRRHAPGAIAVLAGVVGVAAGIDAGLLTGPRTAPGIAALVGAGPLTRSALGG